jgi:hypothetical protein
VISKVVGVGIGVGVGVGEEDLLHPTKQTNDTIIIVYTLNIKYCLILFILILPVLTKSEQVQVPLLQIEKKKLRNEKMHKSLLSI